MYRHLLVPLDGSRLAETALPAAFFLARKLGARVTLLHVVERRAPEEIHGERHLTAPEEARGYLRGAAAGASPADLRVEVHVGAEKSTGVARSIVDYARTAAADLIVMCTHGSSGLRHLLMGSNAQQIIASGRIPVLQVRPSEEPGPGFSCGRLLVPLDSRVEHEAGLATAKELARACDSAVHLLVVVPTLLTLRGERAAAARLSPGATSAVLDMSLRLAEEYLEQLLAGLQGSGFTASGETQRGDPARAIERVAKRLDADLIIVSTHRKTGTDAFWSGSVAPKVSNRSHVPVLLIPLGEKSARS
jgi:nucleotide-binding universal stress UspA family protein